MSEYTEGQKWQARMDLALRTCDPRLISAASSRSPIFLERFYKSVEDLEPELQEEISELFRTTPAAW